MGGATSVVRRARTADNRIVAGQQPSRRDLVVTRFGRNLVRSAFDEFALLMRLNTPSLLQRME